MVFSKLQHPGKALALIFAIISVTEPVLSAPTNTAVSEIDGLSQIPEEYEAQAKAYGFGDQSRAYVSNLVNGISSSYFKVLDRRQTIEEDAAEETLPQEKFEESKGSSNDDEDVSSTNKYQGEELEDVIPENVNVVKEVGGKEQIVPETVLKETPIEKEKETTPILTTKNVPLYNYTTEALGEAMNEVLGGTEFNTNNDLLSQLFPRLKELAGAFVQPIEEKAAELTKIAEEKNPDLPEEEKIYQDGSETPINGKNFEEKIPESVKAEDEEEAEDFGDETEADIENDEKKLIEENPELKKEIPEEFLDEVAKAGGKKAEENAKTLEEDHEDREYSKKPKKVQLNCDTHPDDNDFRMECTQISEDSRSEDSKSGENMRDEPSESNLGAAKDNTENTGRDSSDESPESTSPAGSDESFEDRAIKELGIDKSENSGDINVTTSPNGEKLAVDLKGDGSPDAVFKGGKEGDKIGLLDEDGDDKYEKAIIKGKGPITEIETTDGEELIPTKQVHNGEFEADDILDGALGQDSTITTGEGASKGTTADDNTEQNNEEVEPDTKKSGEIREEKTEADATEPDPEGKGKVEGLEEQKSNDEESASPDESNLDETDGNVDTTQEEPEEDSSDDKVNEEDRKPSTREASTNSQDDKVEDDKSSSVETPEDTESRTAEETFDETSAAKPTKSSASLTSDVEENLLGDAFDDGSD